MRKPTKISTMSFNVTENHLILLRRMFVSWNDCEFGAPTIDPKRPYGNSDVISDMRKILNDEKKVCQHCNNEIGVKMFDDSEYDALHSEMVYVLQILVQHPSGIKPGFYDNVGFTWRRRIT